MQTTTPYFLPRLSLFARKFFAGRVDSWMQHGHPPHLDLVHRLTKRSGLRMFDEKKNGLRRHDRSVAGSCEVNEARLCNWIFDEKFALQPFDVASKWDRLRSFVFREQRACWPRLQSGLFRLRVRRLESRECRFDRRGAERCARRGRDIHLRVLKGNKMRLFGDD